MIMINIISNNTTHTANTSMNAINPYLPNADSSQLSIETPSFLNLSGGVVVTGLLVDDVDVDVKIVVGAIVVVAALVVVIGDAVVTVLLLTVVVADAVVLSEVDIGVTFVDAVFVVNNVVKVSVLGVIAEVVVVLGAFVVVVDVGVVTIVVVTPVAVLSGSCVDVPNEFVDVMLSLPASSCSRGERGVVGSAFFVATDVGTEVVVVDDVVVAVIGTDVVVAGVVVVVIETGFVVICVVVDATLD